MAFPCRRHSVRLPLLFVGGAFFLMALGILHFSSVDPIRAQQGTSGYAVMDPYKDADERVKQFFEEISSTSANPTKAFEDLLRSGAGSSVLNNPSISEMKAKLDEIKTQFGDMRDFEKIDTKSFGKDLVVLRYLLKCDHHPVVWTFTFYRRPALSGSSGPVTNPWSVVGLRFDTNLDLLAL